MAMPSLHPSRISENPWRRSTAARMIRSNSDTPSLPWNLHDGSFGTGILRWPVAAAEVLQFRHRPATAKGRGCRPVHSTPDQPRLGCQGLLQVLWSQRSACDFVLVEADQVVTVGPRGSSDDVHSQAIAKIVALLSTIEALAPLATTPSLRRFPPVE
jgi:hypothetical protein